MSIFFEILVRIGSFGPRIDQSHGEKRLSHIISEGTAIALQTIRPSRGSVWNYFSLYKFQLIRSDEEKVGHETYIAYSNARMTRE